MVQLWPLCHNLWLMNLRCNASVCLRIHCLLTPPEGACCIAVSPVTPGSTRKLCSSAMAGQSHTNYELEVHIMQGKEFPRQRRGERVVVQSSYNEEVSLPNARHSQELQRTRPVSHFAAERDSPSCPRLSFSH